MASVAGWRAIGEMGLVAFALGLGLLAIVPPRIEDPLWAALGLGFVSIGYVAGTLLAVRARRSTGLPGRVVAREIALLLLALVVIGVAMALVSRIAHTFRPTLQAVLPPEARIGSGGVLAIMGGSVTGVSVAMAFVVVRPVVALWPRWDRLRRSRLVWSITHGQLMAAFALAVTAGLALVLVFALGGVGPFGPTDEIEMRDPLVRSFIGFIAGVAGVVAVVVLAAVVVLPVAALVSYLVLRPTTQRLEGLARATNTVRSGDLGARVPVEGEDEVARLQADFNAMAADLERSVTERRELTTAVSHELRTPVATLRAYLESSLEHWDGAPPPTLRRDLEVMEREAERLGRLIDDLFELSRAELGSLALTMGSVDVPALLARSVDAVRPLASDRSRVEIVLDVDEALPPVMADEGRLEQVVRNLLANAIRHTPPGGVIRVAAEADGPPAQTVAIHVEDTGEGIAPADLERVWERFYRTDGSRDRDHGGAGLGLALVKELIEAMGGRVDAASTVGVGSRFSADLPAAAATPLRQTGDRDATGARSGGDLPTRG